MFYIRIFGCEIVGFHHSIAEGFDFTGTLHTVNGQFFTDVLGHNVGPILEGHHVQGLQGPS